MGDADDSHHILRNQILQYKQEAQLMLTTGSTRLAVSRGQQHGTILGPLRLFAKHVTATTRHKSVGYRYGDTSLSF